MRRATGALSKRPSLGRALGRIRECVRGPAGGAWRRGARRLARGRSGRVRVLTRSYRTPFFLIGEMRSGTSWLRRMLAAHPEVACGAEGSFFGRDYARETIPVYTEPVSSLARALWGSADLARWHALPWNRWAGDYDEDARSVMRAAVDLFLAKEVERTGKPIVGDKSPQHTECVDELHEVFPDARIVHIVRDGRDVAVSAMFHWWRLASDRPEGIFELSPDERARRDAYLRDPAEYLASGRSVFARERLEQLARRWSYRVGKARREGRELYGAGYVEVRYEDLVADGAATLREVLSVLGAGTSSAQVARCLEAGSFERAVGRARGHEDPGSFFRKGVAGDWHAFFTDDDRRLYDRFAGERLLELGYESRSRVRA